MTREDREADIADYVAYLDTVAAELARGRPLTVLGFARRFDAPALGRLGRDSRAARGRVGG
jgi:hypothetical protein